MLSTIVFETRKPRKVSNLAIVPQAPKSRRREASFFETLTWPGTKLAEALRSLPNIVWHGHSATGCPAGVPKCLLTGFFPTQKSHPKCNQIQPLSFLGSFICLCVCVRMLNRFLLFRWLLSLPSRQSPLASPVPVLGASSATCVCVCVFECVYVCNVVSCHIMLSNHI